MGSHRVGHKWGDLAAAAKKMQGKHLLNKSSIFDVLIYFSNSFLSISYLYEVLLSSFSKRERLKVFTESNNMKNEISEKSLEIYNSGNSPNF